MVSEMMKLLYILICVLVFVACDEDDHISGEEDPGDGCSEPKCYKDGPATSPLSEDVYKFESYSEGAVVTYLWDKPLPWFLPSKTDKHKYGFDRDPYSNLADYVERGRDVYMSVKTGDDAYLRIYVDPDAKDVFSLRKIDEGNKVIFVGDDICDSDNGCIAEKSLKAGDYAVYYGDVDQKRYLHIKPYSPKTNIIYYVEFGSPVASDCYIGEGNGCYTKVDVENYYNEVMSQVVVSGRFEYMNPKPKELEGDVLVVDLTEESSAYLNNLSDKIGEDEGFGYGTEKKKLDVLKDKLEEISKDDPDYSSVVSKYNSAVEDYNSAFDKFLNKHFVLAINEMRIQWFLSDGTTKNLKNKKDFVRACSLNESICDKSSMTMSMKLSSGNCGVKNIPVKVKIVDDSGDNFNIGVSGYSLKKGCNYIIYADVYPFVPGAPYTAQRTITQSKCVVEYGVKKCDNTVLGGMVWGSHLTGDASLYTIVHEIGHSFGLKDLYIDPNDPTRVPEPYSYAIAMDEKNLMSYQVPSGKRLRYRPLEVVKTGSNERIRLKDGSNAVEKQWDCIRSNKECFIQKD